MTWRSAALALFVLSVLGGPDVARGQAGEAVVARLAGRSRTEASEWSACGAVSAHWVVRVQIVRSTAREIRRGERFDVDLLCPGNIDPDACIELELGAGDVDRLMRDEVPYVAHWRPAPCHRGS